MNSKEEITKKVKSYILETTFSDMDDISNNTMIFKEGILDSMGLITLITFLEDEFAFQTGNEDLLEENFESVNAISDFVVRKTS